MLPVPSAPGHSGLGTQANQAPGVRHQPRSLWPKGNRISISFSIFFRFYPMIWTGVYRWITILWVFFFPFQSNEDWFSWWPEVSFLNLLGCVSLGKNLICIHFYSIPRGDMHDTCLSLTSLGMIIATLFLVAGLSIISYFLIVEKYCIVYMCPIFCVHSSVISTFSLLPRLDYYTLLGRDCRGSHVF